MAWAYWSKKSLAKLNPFSIVVSSPTIDYNAVAWSPKLEIFLAVGEAQSGGINYATSSDGISWTTGSIGQDNIWQSVVWNEWLDLFIAVSSNGTNRIATSSNGTSWTLRSASFAATWVDVASNENITVACRDGGSASLNRFTYSTDTVSWTTGAYPSPGFGSDNRNRSIIYSPVFEKFYTTGELSNLASSDDGINWDLLSVPSPRGFRTVWASKINQIILLAQGDVTNDAGVYSTDGINFITNTQTFSEGRFAGFEEDVFGRIIGIPISRSEYYFSINGINWQPLNDITTNPVYAGSGGRKNIAYSSKLNRFVHVANNYIASN